jgi:hypothetical protein
MRGDQLGEIAGMRRRQEMTAIMDGRHLRIRNVRCEKLCDPHHCRMAVRAPDDKR